MTRVTASEARRRWFELLDAAVAGEVVVVERAGKRVVIRRDDAAPRTVKATPSYAGVLRVPDLDDADSWSWTWAGPGRPLRRARRRRR